MTDRQAVKEVLDGNNQAFAVLVKNYQAKLYRLVYRYIRQVEEARDLTQETFLKAYRNLDSFDQKREFFPWLYKIATNLSLDYLSRRKKIHFETLETEKLIQNRDNGSLSLETDLISRQEREILDSALEKLPPHYRTVIMLRYFEDLSYREMAQIMEPVSYTHLRRRRWIRIREPSR